MIEAGYLPETTDYGSGKETPETEAYARELESLIRPDGAHLVVSTSFGNDPFLFAVARQHPEISFRHVAIAAIENIPKNVGGQNALINQGHYVNGVAAGLCTKTNKLGFVAGETEGAVLVNINSFLLGSRKTNPAATVQVIFTGGWEDAGRDAAATNKLIDAGCDVITCHLDGPKVVIETAEGRGVKTCGHAFNQAPLAPKGYITGAEFNWTPMFEMFVAMLRRGQSLPPFVTGGYDKDYVRSSPFGAGANPGFGQGRRGRHPGDEGRSSDLRWADQGQHRQAGCAGRNDLWALCAGIDADRLSDRGRHRLDQLNDRPSAVGRRLRPVCV